MDNAPEQNTQPKADVISTRSRKFTEPSSALSRTALQKPDDKENSALHVRADELAPEAADTKDPTAITVYLPSRYEFYNFSSISLKPLKGYHQAKFHRAAKEKTDRHVADAITSLLPKGILAEELTIPDFYYILYWLRLNSYTKTNLVHKGVCTNPEHVMKVRAGESSRDTLYTVSIISKSWLKEVQLDEKYLDGFDQELIQLTAALLPLGYTLTAPRIFDSIELDEEYKDVENFEEISYLADRASCIKRTDGVRSTLRERIQVVEELDINIHDMLEEWRLRCSLYGVQESIRFTCKECGADVENPVSISAHSFL